MKRIPKEARQSLGCGYEQPVDRAVPWDHGGRTQHADERDERGGLHLPLCVGYVAALPEVIETSHAADWKRCGELTQFCEGQSTPELREAIGVLEMEQRRVEAWAIDNPEKKP